MSSPSIGSATLQVRADLTRLETDLKRAPALAAREGKAAASAFSNALSGIGAGMAGGMAAGGLAAMIGMFNEVTDRARQASREASSLNVTTNELRGLRMFAKDDAAGFEQGLRRVSKVLGEAAMGSAEAQKAFGRLGLDWARLAGQGTIENFKQISTAVMSLATPAEQAAAATKLLGDEGVRLLPLMKDLAKLDAYQEQAKQFSEWDAALERHWRGWEKITDAIKGAAGAAAGYVAAMTPTGNGPVPVVGPNDKNTFMGRRPQDFDAPVAAVGPPDLTPQMREERAIEERRAGAMKVEIEDATSKIREQVGVLQQGAAAWQLSELAARGATQEQMEALRLAHEQLAVLKAQTASARDLGRAIETAWRHDAGDRFAPGRAQARIGADAAGVAAPALGMGGLGPMTAIAQAMTQVAAEMKKEPEKKEKEQKDSSSYALADMHKDMQKSLLSGGPQKELLKAAEKGNDLQAKAIAVLEKIFGKPDGPGWVV